MRSKKHITLITGVILLLGISRLIPHPYNFTPLGGMAILGAAYFPSTIWKYVVPIVAFYISDLLVTNVLYSGFYADQGFVWFSSHMVWTYGATISIVLVSSVILRRKNFKNILGASVLGAILFFAISNFGSWIADPIYPKTISGLITAYVAGIPFFPATLASTVLYAALGYGVIEYGSARITQPAMS